MSKRVRARGVGMAARRLRGGEGGNKEELQEYRSKWDDMCFDETEESGGGEEVRYPGEMGYDLRDPTYREIIPVQGNYYQPSNGMYASIRGRKVVASNQEIIGFIYMQISTGKLWVSGYTIEAPGDSMYMKWSGKKGTFLWKRVDYHLTWEEQQRVASHMNSKKENRELAQNLKRMEQKHQPPSTSNLTAVKSP